MEVGVRVDAENPITGEKVHSATAYVTFVSLDKAGKPQAVAAIEPVTDAEKRRYQAAMKRRQSRVTLAHELKHEKLKS